MKNVLYLALGAIVFGTCITLWELGQMYLTEGRGLHPMICGWVSALMVVGVIVVAIGDRK